ncbi:DNA-binding GntR family transcriptional regulator [Trinickia symbiotica]|uniref:GntR family transcriptional regulator n=1 Tax=Trinickia symbiotica TaxID=863227 RepID=A0A2N7X4U5_9BURK|nr:GntR family transcriptional regulator [Trinickia symbiotica]PMS36779.1 GntR family transcriptional regulator [Trinickia symbiotica]PPK46228.1 DNA-binding GntR family transcriptional regulator [Trinickia symbiotica]
MPRALADVLATNIHQHITQSGMAPGTRLPERALAEQFNVSRSPVREALKRLAAQSVVAAHPDGGYAVAEGIAPASGAGVIEIETVDADEQTYLAIAEDRLAGRLEDRITENELMRRYGITRAQLHAVLRRMAQEGWIERRPGHGWMFQSVLTSAETYRQGYRYRLLIEAAGILEPTFRLDRDALMRCRIEQEGLANGGVRTASPAALFDANSRLHETIAACSGNVFILDGLRRLDRLRRLMEYRKAVDRDQAERRCREHLTLIDFLLEDQREAAADFMKLHLRNAVREKTSD